MEESNETNVSGAVCSVCGLPVARPGTVTAWIFQTSYCSCPKGQGLIPTEQSADTDATNTQDASEQQLLGNRYRVLEPLGRGGVARVYKVQDSVTMRILAAKVMLTELALNDLAVKRFQKEVDVLAGITHENLVKIHGYAMDGNGLPYLIMDFIDGRNLEEEIKIGGPLDVDRAINVFLQICNGLKCVHDYGIIHRDLKPSNVIVSSAPHAREDRVTVIDFGFAKILDDAQDSRLTSTGEVFGSPSYMSPEHCLGQELDARSDIYSFGCLMYEALTGKAPVDDENPVRIVVKQLSEKPKSWTNTPDGKPLKGMEAIVFRCLEKDKEERYQTVAELLKDLNLIAAGKKTANLDRSQLGKASLTLGQAITYTLVGCFLLFYMTSVSVSYIYAFKCLILLPVALLVATRNLVRFKFGGTNWNRWQTLIALTLTALGLTGVVVFSGVLQFWENLPTAFHYVYAINMVLHRAILCIACGVVIAGFIFQDNNNLSWRRISKQASLVSLVILALGFLPLGTLSPIIPSSLVMGMSMSSNERAPNVNIAVTKTALSLGAYKLWGAIKLADNYEKLNESAKGLPYLEAAIEGNEDSLIIDDALKHRARAYIATGEFDKALQDLARALKTNSTGYSAASYYELQGDAYKGLRENEKAISAYRQSLESDPTNNPVSSKLIGLLVRLQDWKSAIDDIKKDTANDHSAESILRRAMIYDQADLKDKAKADYQDLVKVMKNIKDKPPEPFFLEEPTLTIFKIVRILNPPEDYKKLVGKQYLIRAYANQQLGNLDQAAKDAEAGISRGATFAEINPVFQKESGLKIDL